MRVPLIYKRRPTFGLDIGSHSAKFVQIGKHGKQTVVEAYGYAPYPADLIVEGIISDPEPIAAAIKQALKHPVQGVVSSRRAVISIPASKLFTRVLDLPAMGMADLMQAVNFEAEQYVPVPLADIYLDYTILGHSKNDKGEEHVEVLMVAAPRAVVDSYMKLFDMVGIEVSGVESNLSAIMRAMQPIAPVARPVLIVDIGSDSTNLALYDPVPRLTGTFEMGGDNFTNTLVKALGVKADQAMEIKHKFGINSSDMQAKVFKALAPQLENIANEVNKALKFYRDRGAKPTNDKEADSKATGAPNSPVKSATETLLLAGGTANMPGLADYLHQQNKVPVVVGDPWMDISFGKLQEPPEGETIAYATAIGLALQNFRTQKLPLINLLPMSVKQEITYAKRNNVIMRYAMLIVAVAAGIGAGFLGSHMYLDNKLAETTNSIAAKDLTASSYRDVETAAKTLNSRVAAIKAIQDSQPKFSAVLSDLAKAVPQDASIASLALTGDDTKPVKISADAASYQAAVSFRDALAASPRISGADIDSISGNDAEGYRVDITIGFKAGQAK